MKLHRLLKMFRPELDYRFKPDRGLSVRIMERPGVWLPEDEQRRLVEELRELCRASMKGMELDYGIFKHGSDRLKHAVLTLIRDDATGKLIAFNALSLLDVPLNGRVQPVVHLGLVMIDPGVRARGLSWILYGLTVNILFLRNQLRPLWITNVTQVPAIFGMVSEAFGEVYPSAEPGARRSFVHLMIAREIVKNHAHVFGVGGDSTFDEEHFVIRNAYTGGSDNLKKTWDAAPKHRRPEPNDYCHRHLDYDRGDDFLQIGQMSIQATRNYVFRSVPRRSLLKALYALAFLTVESLLIPVYQWFIVDESFGPIRPHTRRARKAA